MKKIVFVLLAVLAVFCLVSCDHGNTSTPDSAPTPWYVGTWKSDEFIQHWGIFDIQLYGELTLKADGGFEVQYKDPASDNLLFGYRGTYTLNKEETSVSTNITELYEYNTDAKWKACNPINDVYTIAKVDATHLTIVAPSRFTTEPTVITCTKQ